nr:hypothetical protein [Shewanella japonica]
MMANLNISIPLEKMALLIQSGHLCVADFKSLDQQTKQKLWQLCLLSCKKRVNCTNASQFMELIEQESQLETDRIDIADLT